MRGTIGGIPGDNLTPIDIVEMTAAYGELIKRINSKHYGYLKYNLGKFRFKFLLIRKQVLIVKKKKKSLFTFHM